MHKQTIKYEDFEGEKREMTCYFHLSKPEIVDLAIDGTFEGHIKAMIEANDIRGVINELKMLIDISYGKKSEDGQRFIKTPEYLLEFQQTAAYDELYLDLVSDPAKAANFVKGIVPKGLIVETQDKPSLPPPSPKTVDI